MLGLGSGGRTPTTEPHLDTLVRWWGFAYSETFEICSLAAAGWRLGWLLGTADTNFPDFFLIIKGSVAGVLCLGLYYILSGVAWGDQSTNC